MLPPSSMVGLFTPSMPREFGVWGDYQACKETQHTSKQESLGWHWWADSSHQAYKQGEIGVKFLVGNLALVCVWYKKCTKVLLLGLVQCFMLPPSSMVGLLSCFLAQQACNEWDYMNLWACNHYSSSSGCIEHHQASCSKSTTSLPITPCGPAFLHGTHAMSETTIWTLHEPTPTTNLIILRLSRASPSILLLVYHFIAHHPISFLYPILAISYDSFSHTTSSCEPCVLSSSHKPYTVAVGLY